MNNLSEYITLLTNRILNLQKFIGMPPIKKLSGCYVREIKLRNTQFDYVRLKGYYTDKYGTWIMYFAYDKNDNIVLIYSFCHEIRIIQ